MNEDSLWNILVKCITHFFRLSYTHDFLRNNMCLLTVPITVKNKKQNNNKNHAFTPTYTCIKARRVILVPVLMVKDKLTCSIFTPLFSADPGSVQSVFWCVQPRAYQEFQVKTMRQELWQNERRWGQQSSMCVVMTKKSTITFYKPSQKWCWCSKALQRDGATATVSVAITRLCHMVVLYIHVWDSTLVIHR